MQSVYKNLSTTVPNLENFRSFPNKYSITFQSEHI